MRTAYEQIVEFETAFDPNFTGVPETPVKPSDETVKLRISLIEEECKEVVEAIDNGNDLGHIAKELSDLLYVVYGTAAKYGIDIDSPKLVSNELHYVDLLKEYIERNTKNLVADIKFGGDDYDMVGSYMRQLVAGVHFVAVLYGLDIDECFKIVHENNMSKVDPETGKPNYREDGKLLKPEGYQKVDLNPHVWRASYEYSKA